jgi:hypothetical protein
MPDRPPDAASAAEATPMARPQRSRLYWFAYHTRHGAGAFLRRNAKPIILSGVVLLVLAFLLRAWIQPLFLAVRIRIYWITLFLPALALLWLAVRRRDWKVKAVALAAVAAALTGFAATGTSPVHYMSLYSRWNALRRVELERLPVTGHERVQPRNSIVALANEAMQETETPAPPHFLRIGSDYRWTMGIEPAYAVRRLTRGVDSLFSVPGTDASPSFSGENRVAAHFETGEHLLLWHRTDLNVIRSFGPWRYLNFEPEDVKYLTDDRGEWVQVVSLTRWRGLFFPQPYFGGVQVIRRNPGAGLADMVRRLFVGVGEWIPPDRINDHPFLRGQSLLPRQVSRHIAESFRFQSGFFAPMPGYHLGDVRIPDLPGDVHDQPFTLYFDFGLPGIPAGLFQYFALEPFQLEKQGLNTSLFIPADGTPVVYVYPHHKRAESLTGVSAIGAKVMETRKQYDWDRNRPVEHRPFIREIGGRPRFYWLTTVVTLKDQTGSFIAGSAPEVALTDAATREVAWVDARKPEDWARRAATELAPKAADAATTAAEARQTTATAAQAADSSQESTAPAGDSAGTTAAATGALKQPD